MSTWLISRCPCIGSRAGATDGTNLTVRLLHQIVRVVQVHSSRRDDGQIDKFLGLRALFRHPFDFLDERERRVRRDDGTVFAVGIPGAGMAGCWHAHRNTHQVPNPQLPPGC